MKNTIKINDQEVEFFNSFDEAKANCVEGTGEQWARIAIQDITKFIKECEATGVAKLIWARSADHWAGINFEPLLLVDGVAMKARHTAGPSSNYYFFGVDYVWQEDRDRWKYDQPKPHNVGKPTAKALKAWAQWIKDEHTAAIEHKKEEQKNRASLERMNRAKLKKAGFTPYYTREDFDSARVFSCTRGGVDCTATIGVDCKLHFEYTINYCECFEIFKDIRY